MNWKLPASIALSALLIVGGVTLPELLLRRQEESLYAQQVNVEVAYSRFERQDTTLVQRLDAARRSGSFTALDFDVGAGLYWSREELMERFAEETSALAQALPSLPGLPYLAETLSRPAGELDQLVDLSYQCVVDTSTGGTYVFAHLDLYDGDYASLFMDTVTGKLVAIGCYPDQLLGVATNAFDIAQELAAYLGLEGNTKALHQDISEDEAAACVNTRYLLTDPEHTGEAIVSIVQNPEQGLLISTLSEGN